MMTIDEAQQVEDLQEDEIEVRDDENDFHETLEHLAGAGTEDSQVDHDDELDKDQEQVGKDKKAKDTEDEEYGKKVERRVGKLTKKWRDEERVRKAEQERADALQQRLDELEEKQNKAAEERYENSEKAIKERIKAAAEQEDWTEVMKGNDELRELDKDQYSRVVKERKAPAKVKTAETSDSPEIAPSAQKWMEDNDSWFSTDSPDYDEDLAIRAIRWSNKLQKEDMYNVNDPQLYARINKELGLGQDEEEEEERNPTRFVDRGRRSTNTGSRGPVRKKSNPNILNARDKKLMRVFLLDPDSKADQADWIKRRNG